MVVKQKEKENDQQIHRIKNPRRKGHIVEN
jgi:hypothetical protein